MPNRTLPIALLIASWLLIGQSAPLEAGLLRLTGETIIWDPSDTPVSPRMVIGIINEAPDAERLVGWQLTLSIVAQPGAVGTLQFNAASLPDNYVLAGLPNAFSATFPNAPARDMLRVFDENTTLAGATIPASGSNLVAIDFTTPDGAVGNFDVYALPGLANSIWTEITTAQQRDFEGLLRTSSTPLWLGTVTAVPEPSGLALGGLATLFFSAIGFRRVVRRQALRIQE